MVMRVVCYNTDKHKNDIFSDWIAFHTNSVYLSEHKGAPKLDGVEALK